MGLSGIRARLLAIGVLLVSLALATACGGEEEPRLGESPTPQGGSPTAEASSPTPQGSSAAACQAIQDLKSYRYTMHFLIESPEPPTPPATPLPTPSTLITTSISSPIDYTVDASYVAPDRFDAMTTMKIHETGEERTVAIVIIGNRHWYKSGDQWTENPNALLGYLPPDICSAIFPDLNLPQAEPERESVNGVKALHYSLPDVFSEHAMAQIFGAGSVMDLIMKRLNVDLWLAEDGGWPVRMEIRSSGVFSDGSELRELRLELIVDLRDVNSDEIKVEPPA
ncbi:MAG: hypothetical protein ABSB57_00100 [Dehalococcoidia bacterium]